MDNLGPGSVVEMSAFNRQYFDDDGKEMARFGYKATKGRAFVFVLLGAVERGKQFDAAAALQALGWTPPADLIAASQHEQKEG